MSRRVNIAVSLPIELVTVVDAIADSEGVTFSRIYERLLRRSLALERDEREAKAKSDK